MGAAVSPIRRKGAVGSAAEVGRRELLEALRDKIAAEIDGDCHPRDLAALSRRLVDIAEQLDSMTDAVDDIAVAAAIVDEAWSAE